jgi:hypothetical protein
MFTKLIKKIVENHLYSIATSGCHECPIRVMTQSSDLHASIREELDKIIKVELESCESSQYSKEKTTLKDGRIIAIWVCSECLVHRPTNNMWRRPIQDRACISYLCEACLRNKLAEGNLS